MIVDPKNEIADTAGLTAELREAVTGQTKTTASKEAALESDLPEKYRGKTAAQIAEMHLNAEKRLGELGNEVGRYKSMTDELLQLKRTENFRQEEEEEPALEIDSADFLDSPSESIERVVEATLAKREAETRKMQEQMSSEAAAFNSLYPDASEIVNNPGFAEWVKQSKTRMRIAQEAYNNDYEAAGILIEDYKQSVEATSATEEYIPPDTESASKAATTPVGASSASSSSGKVYRRLDLIKLKLEKPDVYGDPQFQREIMDAYATGRVR